MKKEEPIRHNNLNLIMAFVGAAMIASSAYKDEIEPYRAAVRDVMASVISLGAGTAQAAPVVPAAR